jgi:hypothetical protein
MIPKGTTSRLGGCAFFVWDECLGEFMRKEMME